MCFDVILSLNFSLFFFAAQFNNYLVFLLNFYAIFTQFLVSCEGSPACSGNGLCNGGKCTCEASYGGPDCSQGKYIPTSPSLSRDFSESLRFFSWEKQRLSHTIVKWIKMGQIHLFIFYFKWHQLEICAFREILVYARHFRVAPPENPQLCTKILAWWSRFGLFFRCQPKFR